MIAVRMPLSLVRAENAVQIAADILTDQILQTVDRCGSARLAIPGGSAIDVVGRARRQLGAGWKRVLLTWVDERCVPFGCIHSNRGAAYRRGALDPSLPPADELPLFLNGETGEASVLRVGAELDDRFGGRVDVVLLGLGHDGHVASLFAGWMPPVGARVAHVASSPKPPTERITLTRVLLDCAEVTVLLVVGENKRAALEQLLSGDPNLPAHGLPGLLVVTDLHQETR